MALFSSTQPSLRARVLPRFPAQVLAGNGMTITKSGGTYTFAVNQTLDLWDIKAHGAVGDGVTDDTAAIQNWLASGETLYASAGTYLHSAELNIPTSVRVIFGSGVFKYGGPNGLRCIRVDITNGLYIRDIGLMCNPLTHISCSGIGIFDSNNVVLDGVRFLDTAAFGVEAAGNTNCGIINCKFTASADIQYAAYNINCSNLLMQGNILLANQVCEIGLYAESSSNVSIQDNIIHKSGGFGIQTYNCVGSLISGNIISDSLREAIRVDGGAAASDFIISDNVINSPTGLMVDFGIGIAAFDAGGTLSRGSIENNIITKAGVSAIGIGTGDGALSNITVSGNTIIDPNQTNTALHAGIVLLQNGAGTVTGVTVADNVMISGDGHMPYGIMERGSVNSTKIRNNTIRGAATGDILLVGAASRILSHITDSGLINAANDAAAAGLGVSVGSFYRNGSVVQVRVV